MPGATGKAAPKIRAVHDAPERHGGHYPHMAITHIKRLCTLEATVGRSEACPEDGCPFWEPGGAALDGRCAFEELGISADARLATWLLEIRERLDSARSTADADEVRRLFGHLLNDSAE